MTIAGEPSLLLTVHTTSVVPSLALHSAWPCTAPHWRFVESAVATTCPSTSTCVALVPSPAGTSHDEPPAGAVPLTDWPVDTFCNVTSTGCRLLLTRRKLRVPAAMSSAAVHSGTRTMSTAGGTGAGTVVDVVVDVSGAAVVGGAVVVGGGLVVVAAGDVGSGAVGAGVVGSVGGGDPTATDASATAVSEATTTATDHRTRDPARRPSIRSPILCVVPADRPSKANVT